MRISALRIGGVEDGLITDEAPRIGFALDSDVPGEDLASALVTVGDWECRDPRSDRDGVHRPARTLHRLRGEGHGDGHEWRSGRGIRIIPHRPARHTVDGPVDHGCRLPDTPEAVPACADGLPPPLRADRSDPSCLARVDRARRLRAQPQRHEGRRPTTSRPASPRTSTTSSTRRTTSPTCSPSRTRSPRPSRGAGRSAPSPTTARTRSTPTGRRSSANSTSNTQTAPPTSSRPARTGKSAPTPPTGWPSGTTARPSTPPSTLRTALEASRCHLGRTGTPAVVGAVRTVRQSAARVRARRADGQPQRVNWSTTSARTSPASSARASAATTARRVVFRHAEVLVDDELFVTSLRTAKATATYTCVDGEQEYSPTLTYMGFRYVGVRGIDPTTSN